MSKQHKTPMYKFTAMRKMYDKGASFEEIGAAMKMTADEAEAILRQGASINRKFSENVGLVHKMGNDYIYLLPGDVWLGAKNRRIGRVTNVNPSAVKVVEPYMTTEELLKAWGVSHSDLVKAERKYIERAHRGLPIRREGAIDDANRLKRIATRRDTLLRKLKREEGKKKKGVKEGLGELLQGKTLDDVVIGLLNRE